MPGGGYLLVIWLTVLVYLFEYVVKQMDNLDWTRLLYLKLNLFLFTTPLLYDILQLTQQLSSWQIVPLTVFHVPFLYKRWHKRIKRPPFFTLSTSMSHLPTRSTFVVSSTLDRLMSLQALIPLTFRALIW